MLFFIEKIRRLNFNWNERSLTETDFYRLCKRHKVAVEEMPLSVSGFYYCLLGKHYIAINSRLRPEKKLFVMFHEFAHFLMHAPDDGVTANFHGVGRKTRKEIEADAFALCAVIPRSLIRPGQLEDLVEENGFSHELVTQRLQLFRRLGI